jgi:hypothetical protein
VPAATEQRGEGEGDLRPDCRVSPTERARSRFSLVWSPRARPVGPGMAWARRMDEGPNPGKNEEPGARLGQIPPSGCKKRPPGAESGERARPLEANYVFACGAADAMWMTEEVATAAGHRGFQSGPASCAFPPHLNTAGVSRTGQRQRVPRLLLASARPIE